MRLTDHEAVSVATPTSGQRQDAAMTTTPHSTAPVTIRGRR